jgi:uncharacterized protein (DUF2461 family)
MTRLYREIQDSLGVRHFSINVDTHFLRTSRRFTHILRFTIWETIFDRVWAADICPPKG